MMRRSGKNVRHRRRRRILDDAVNKRTNGCSKHLKKEGTWGANDEDEDETRRDETGTHRRREAASSDLVETSDGWGPGVFHGLGRGRSWADHGCIAGVKSSLMVAFVQSRSWLAWAWSQFRLRLGDWEYRYPVSGVAHRSSVR